MDIFNKRCKDLQKPPKITCWHLKTDLNFTDKITNVIKITISKDFVSLNANE